MLDGACTKRQTKQTKFCRTQKYCLCRNHNHISKVIFDKLSILTAYSHAFSHSNGARMVCDRFHVKSIGDRTFIVLADGCGWAEAAKTAAIQAVKVQYDGGAKFSVFIFPDGVLLGGD